MISPRFIRHATASSPEVTIVGGGIAGVEALLALADQGAGHVRLHLVAAHPSFSLRPQLVGEPWGHPPLRVDLGTLCGRLGARFTQARVNRVDPAARCAWTSAGDRLGYDRLLLAPGGRLALPYPLTRVVGFGALPRTLADAETGSVAIVVPPGTTWTLPAYELALLTATDHPDRKVRVITPEASPLELFGPGAAAEISNLLARMGVVVECGRRIEHGTDPGGLADAVVALPVVHGPGLAGLEQDADGFIRVGPDMAVAGTNAIWAVGDAAGGGVKQGGLAAQQADRAAAAIVRSAGGTPPVTGALPVLRGKLAAGGQELYLRRVLDGEDPGEASPLPLWQPAGVVCAWRVARWLEHERAGGEAVLEHVGPA